MKLIKALIIQISTFYFLLLSHLYKRNNNYWVFGSRQGLFIDNPKYFFLYVNNNFPEINCTWISSNKGVVATLNDEGFNAFYKWSFKGVLATLKAKYFVYAFDSDDINYYLSGGAKMVNLYHGLPLKKIEFDTGVGNSAIIYNPVNIKQLLKSKFLYPQKWQTVDLFQVPSKLMADIFYGAYQGRIKNFHYGLSPRLEYLSQGKSKPESLISSLEKYNSICLYMPTWRRTNSGLVSDPLPDLDILNAALKNKNNVLLIKMHLYSSTALKKHSNIIIVPSEDDIYEFINGVDVLITDYSSIMFDFALTGKNLVFYNYDHESYLKEHSENFYFNYSDITDNKAFSEFDTLVNVLNDELSNVPQPMSKCLVKQIWEESSPQDIYESNTDLVKRIRSL